jgi:hypothetical protein
MSDDERGWRANGVRYLDFDESRNDSSDRGGGREDSKNGFCDPHERVSFFIPATHFRGAFSSPARSAFG